MTSCLRTMSSILYDDDRQEFEVKETAHVGGNGVRHKNSTLSSTLAIKTLLKF